MSRKWHLVSLSLLFSNPPPSHSVMIKSRWHRSRLFELHRRFLQHRERPRTHARTHATHQANSRATRAHKTHSPSTCTQNTATPKRLSGRIRKRGGATGWAGDPKTWSVGSRECKPNSGKCSCDRLVCVSTTSHVNARDPQDGVKGKFCHFLEMVYSRHCCVGSNSGSDRATNVSLRGAVRVFLSWIRFMAMVYDFSRNQTMPMGNE